MINPIKFAGISFLLLTQGLTLCMEQQHPQTSRQLAVINPLLLSAPAQSRQNSIFPLKLNLDSFDESKQPSTNNLIPLFIEYTNSLGDTQDLFSDNAVGEPQGEQPSLPAWVLDTRKKPRPQRAWGSFEVACPLVPGGSLENRIKFALNVAPRKKSGRKLGLGIF